MTAGSSHRYFDNSSQKIKLEILVAKLLFDTKATASSFAWNPELKRKSLYSSRLHCDPSTAKTPDDQVAGSLITGEIIFH
jgi:hypothetical protein